MTSPTDRPPRDPASADGDLDDRDRRAREVDDRHVDDPDMDARTQDLRALAGDLVAVVVFVVLGRSSHREGETAAGIAATAWPFVTGALLGWAAVLALRAGGRRLRARGPATGAVVLVGTVAGGMALRRLFTSGGTPIAFLLVATSFLGLFLLGWRAAVGLRARALRSRAVGSGPSRSGPAGSGAGSDIDRGPGR